MKKHLNTLLFLAFCLSPMALAKPIFSHSPGHHRSHSKPIPLPLKTSSGERLYAKKMDLRQRDQLSFGWDSIEGASVGYPQLVYGTWGILAGPKWCFEKQSDGTDYPSNDDRDTECKILGVAVTADVGPVGLKLSTGGGYLDRQNSSSVRVQWSIYRPFTNFPEWIAVKTYQGPELTVAYDINRGAGLINIPLRVTVGYLWNLGQKDGSIIDGSRSQEERDWLLSLSGGVGF